MCNYLYVTYGLNMDFSGGSDGKEPAYSTGDQVQSLDQEDPLEKETTTHSSILDWRIPWTEEAGRLQPIQLQRFGHNRVSFTSPYYNKFEKKIVTFWQTLYIYIINALALGTLG